jgi:homospermidine synthase
VIAVDNCRVWISNKYGMMVGDMEGVNKINFISVINKLKKTAKKLGVGQIQFHCSPGTSLHDLFSANYKATPSFHVLFKDFGSAIAPEQVKFTFGDIDIF